MLLWRQCPASSSLMFFEIISVEFLKFTMMVVKVFCLAFVLINLSAAQLVYPENDTNENRKPQSHVRRTLSTHFSLDPSAHWPENLVWSLIAQKWDNKWEIYSRIVSLLRIHSVARENFSIQVYFQYLDISRPWTFGYSQNLFFSLLFLVVCIR